MRAFIVAGFVTGHRKPWNVPAAVAANVGLTLLNVGAVVLKVKPIEDVGATVVNDGPPENTSTPLCVSAPV
jgi:hypothetical protein